MFYWSPDSPPTLRLAKILTMSLWEIRKATASPARAACPEGNLCCIVGGTSNLPQASPSLAWQPVTMPPIVHHHNQEYLLREARKETIHTTPPDPRSFRETMTERASR